MSYVQPVNVLIRMAEQVSKTLLKDISNFRMLPGDRFTETDMSRRFTASRTPVRDALFLLKRNASRVYETIKWKVRKIMPCMMHEARDVAVE